TKVSAYPVELNSDHKWKIFANLRGVSTYFAVNFRFGCMNYLRLDESFALEAGGSLPGITIAYHTYGRLNADGSNVVWVCHALTANSDVARWWPGVVGEHGVVRPGDYFIVCANILGSCYGSSGPVGAGPGVGEHGVGLDP